MSSHAALVTFSLVLLSCTTSNATPPTGTVGRPCRPDSMGCDPGLVCHLDLCIEAQRDPQDGGVVDGDAAGFDAVSTQGPLHFPRELNVRGIYVVEEGLLVVTDTKFIVMNEDGEVLREAEHLLATGAAFDGERIFFRVRARDGEIPEGTLAFTDLAFGPATPIEGPICAHPALGDGRVVCPDYEGLRAVDVEQGTRFSMAFRDRLPLRPIVVPGYTPDRFVVSLTRRRSDEGDFTTRTWLFRWDESTGPELVAAEERTRPILEGVFQARYSAHYWLHQVGDELIDDHGGRYDIGSEACLERGECFGETIPPGDQPYALADSALANSRGRTLVVMPNERFLGTEFQLLSLGPEECFNCNVERWDLDTGVVETTSIALPRFYDYPDRDPRDRHLQLDPWRGGAWFWRWEPVPSFEVPSYREVYRIRFD